jgi:hypothetical protein
MHVPDDRAAFRAAHALLRPVGYLVTFASAFPFAMSKFDDAVGHVRWRIALVGTASPGRWYCCSGHLLLALGFGSPCPGVGTSVSPFRVWGRSMANYRKIMILVLEGRSDGEIVETVGCSRRDVSVVK